jgi:hypothetical protein
MEKAMTQCLNCRSTAIVRGWTVAVEGRTTVFVFRNTDGYANATYAGVVIPHESQVCLHCGLHWNALPTERLEKLRSDILENGTEEVKALVRSRH